MASSAEKQELDDAVLAASGAIIQFLQDSSVPTSSVEPFKELMTNNDTAELLERVRRVAASMHLHLAHCRRVRAAIHNASLALAAARASDPEVT